MHSHLGSGKDLRLNYTRVIQDQVLSIFFGEKGILGEKPTPEGRGSELRRGFKESVSHAFIHHSRG